MWTAHIYIHVTYVYVYTYICMYTHIVFRRCTQECKGNDDFAFLWNVMQGCYRNRRFRIVAPITQLEHFACTNFRPGSAERLDMMSTFEFIYSLFYCCSRSRNDACSLSLLYLAVGFLETAFAGTLSCLELLDRTPGVAVAVDVHRPNPVWLYLPMFSKPEQTENSKKTLL